MHISFKHHPNRPPVVARGRLAIGQFSCGIVNLSQFGAGPIAVSQFALAGAAVAQIGAPGDAYCQFVLVHQGVGRLLIKFTDVFG